MQTIRKIVASSPIASTSIFSMAPEHIGITNHIFTVDTRIQKELEEVRVGSVESKVGQKRRNGRKCAFRRGPASGTHRVRCRRSRIG